MILCFSHCLKTAHKSVIGAPTSTFKIFIMMSNDAKMIFFLRIQVTLNWLRNILVLILQVLSPYELLLATAICKL